MNRSASDVHEHVVVRILQCEASDDGRAAILDIDTNSGPLRLRLARPFLHTLIGAASTAQYATSPRSEATAPAAGAEVPPIVRFLTTVQEWRTREADNDQRQPCTE